MEILDIIVKLKVDVFFLIRSQIRGECSNIWVLVVRKYHGGRVFISGSTFGEVFGLGKKCSFFPNADEVASIPEARGPFF